MNDEKTLIRNKLNSELSRRSKDIGEAVQKMEESGQMLDDFLVPSKNLYFDNNGKVSVGWSDEAMGLHRNAISQLAGRFGINGKDLQREANGSEWEREVFKQRMNAYGANAPTKNLLIRKYDGQAKAVLSDKYRRMNTAAIFIAFMSAAMETGSVLVDASHGELRDFLEVIHPEIVEIPTEKNGLIYTAFGAQIRNSDFGASKLELNVYQMNVVCLNGLVAKKMISDVHLGSKIEGSGNISFSEETMDADTHARALAVRDIMKSVYSKDNITRERQRIVDATEIELDFVQEIKQLPKMGVLQGEVDLLNKTLMDNNPDDGIQGRNTLWKMAQGLTAVANKIESADRKRDLQDIASSMISSYVKA
jgi:hypothetical protein